METVTLWRVETKEGQGIFESGLLDQFTFYDSDPVGYPSMMEDIGVRFSESARSACISVAQLKHWFGMPDIVEWLSYHCAQVVEIECPKEYILQGRTQVLYGHRHAKVVKTLLVSELPIL